MQFSSSATAARCILCYTVDANAIARRKYNGIIILSICVMKTGMEMFDSRTTAKKLDRKRTGNECAEEVDKRALAVTAIVNLMRFVLIQ